MRNTDIVFACRKCGHLLFLHNSKIKIGSLVDIMGKDCPSCGEEGYENWILARQGNYKEEYGEEDFYPRNFLQQQSISTKKIPKMD